MNESNNKPHAGNSSSEIDFDDWTRRFSNCLVRLRPSDAPKMVEFATFAWVSDGDLVPEHVAETYAAFLDRGIEPRQARSRE